MEYFLKILLMICIVMYIMDVITGINYVMKIRKFNILFNKTFKDKEESEINEDEATAWQDYHKKTVGNAFSIFISFVISSLIFSIMLIIFNI